MCSPSQQCVGHEVNVVYQCTLQSTPRGAGGGGGGCCIDCVIDNKK